MYAGLFRSNLEARARVSTQLKYRIAHSDTEFKSLKNNVLNNSVPTYLLSITILSIFIVRVLFMQTSTQVHCYDITTAAYEYQ